jgi:hypothetical protein
MARIRKTTHGSAPCGRVAFLAFPFANLYFATDAMVSLTRVTIEGNDGGMMRRGWMLLALALAACGRTERMSDLFPEVAAGEWRRTSLRDLAGGESPDPVPRTSVDHVQIATYEGPGKLDARVYRLSSAAVGVDLAQRWHPSADTVFFNQGRYFVVVKWQGAERKALQAFVRELEGRLSIKDIT